MQIVRFAQLAIVACAFTGAASPAFADESASGSFGVRVVVPAYCEVSTSPILLDQTDGFASGSVFESCNTQEGFQVMANYRELGLNERVDFSYAGMTSTLNAAGQATVANRVGAKFGVRPIGVSYSGLEAPLEINLTVTYF